MEKRICLRINIGYHNGDACGLCGRYVRPTLGPALFVEGTDDLVCDECGKVTPEFDLVQLGRAAEDYMAKMEQPPPRRCGGECQCAQGGDPFA